jgi:hypothetical protein
MRWKAERTDEFEEWWKTLSEPEKTKIRSSIGRLSALGPGCGRPLVDSVEGSKHSNLKELRATQTIRVFFAFDPRRKAVLLIGGDKAGKSKRFYRQIIPKADQIYDIQLGRIQEGNGHGK